LTLIGVTHGFTQIEEFRSIDRPNLTVRNLDESFRRNQFTYSRRLAMTAGSCGDFGDIEMPVVRLLEIEEGFGRHPMPAGRPRLS